MTRYRNALPQLGADIFLTDGGIETTLIFRHGFELPHFATFVLHDDARGRAAMRQYYRKYLDIANKARCGFVLESATWRANPEWAARLGFDSERLVEINRRAIAFLERIRDEYAGDGLPIVISGNIGPRGSGYVAGDMMTSGEASEYHELQIRTFAETAADMVTAMTMTYPGEAIGIVRAAQAAGLPAVIGFTTETDGRLPNGQTLREAIEQVDSETGAGPAYYMVNCAHTDHFSHSLQAGETWTGRIRCLRANASRLSHAELDECEALDSGDPHEFGLLYGRLKQRFPQLAVFGGCCGTDHRHIEAASQAIN